MTVQLGRVVVCVAAAIAWAGCATKIAPPVATAGSSVSVNMGDSVVLDGSSSSDPQGQALTYDWSFQSRPLTSRASFNDPHVNKPSFVPDVDGNYVVQLVVTNSVLSSPPSQITVTVKKCG